MNFVQRSRSTERNQKLLELKRQQSLEDMQAFQLTQDQLEALNGSFQSVKVEFFDLDGMAWTKSALLRSAMPRRIFNSSPDPNQPPIGHDDPLSLGLLIESSLSSSREGETIRSPRFSRRTSPGPSPSYKRTFRRTVSIHSSILRHDPSGNRA